LGVGRRLVVVLLVAAAAAADARCGTVEAVRLPNGKLEIYSWNYGWKQTPWHNCSVEGKAASISPLFFCTSYST